MPKMRASGSIFTEQSDVDVIPLGHAETGAEAMAGCTGTVRLELAGE